MSTSGVRQGPSPPTVEQILEDLSSATDHDVVFMKSPLFAEHATSATNASSQPELDEDRMHETLNERDQNIENKGSFEQREGEGQSNEQLYCKVASFLEQFKSLESAQEQLKGLEPDLKSTKEGLGDAIKRVEQAWKVDKADAQ